MQVPQATANSPNATSIEQGFNHGQSQTNTPWEHLAEFLDELEITRYRLAKTILVPPSRINEIVHGRRSITADTALRIARALGTTPEFWLNLQRRYDLDVARDSLDIDAIVPLVSHEGELRAA